MSPRPSGSLVGGGGGRVARASRYRWERYRRRAAQLVGRRRRDAVLFVCGPGGDARRYRCDHQAEQLDLAGVPARVSYRDGLRLASLAGRYRAVVLYRVPWDEDVAELVARARGAGTTVLADVDDLVFDPDRLHWIRGLEELDERDRLAYAKATGGLRRTLAEADGVVVSTEPLRAEVSHVNANVAVAFNAVSVQMAEQGERARSVRSNREDVVIAYLSGTPTHDRDFLEAADAVLWALERHRHVRFLAVGYLTPDARFDAFGDRVMRTGPVRWQELPEILTRIDVNLAPLERDNPVTKAKSCLKYLEAGLLGVPAVASPRPDFARVIEHGANGLLADDPESWRAALGALIESPELRARVGDAAHLDVHGHHTTAARAESTARAFGSLLGRDALSPSGEIPSSSS